MPSRITKHLMGAAFVFVIGLLLSCFSIWPLVNGRAGANWFIYLVFGIIGIYVLLTSIRVMWAASGSSKFENVFPLSLSAPTSIDIVAPHAMHGGKVVIYFADSVKLYRGNIALLLKQSDSQVELGRASLSGTKPSFRIPIPIWFKWFHVQEAGATLDFWPRGASRSFDPVIIPFTHAIAEGDALLLKIDVQNVLAAKGEGRHGNALDSDFVTVCVKA